MLSGPRVGWGGSQNPRSRTAPQKSPVYGGNGPPPPVISYMLQDKPLPPSVPQFPHLRNREIINGPSLRGPLGGFKEPSAQCLAGAGSRLSFLEKNLRRQLLKRERETERKGGRDREGEGGGSRETC